MAKATTTSRGYGARHEQIREQWQRRIKRDGGTECHAIVCIEPTRQIRYGQPWDLGHTPDRTAYTGPEHPTCNRSAGGRNGAAVTNARRATPALRHSRQW